ncbi:MAG: cell division protein FtsL [Gammaproteobacteria bacterium]|nr:cell division protein FtsL [Gammaproteobacteria bacterium]MCH9716961.1 cell division protein FtsL [Gammaproteobacteria bacterium]MCH9762781.1 cell division protein FtsL [Gammaproteobacteria bacterium]
MNAAAKMIQQSSVFQGHGKIQLSTAMCLQITLLFFVLMSALSVVYVINLHRVTCGQMQMADQKAHRLQLQWGQLLLEQASLATPARVERLAKDKLQMVFPTHEKTFALRAE